MKSMVKTAFKSIYSFRPLLSFTMFTQCPMFLQLLRSMIVEITHMNNIISFMYLKYPPSVVIKVIVVNLVVAGSMLAIYYGAERSPYYFYYSRVEHSTHD